MSHLTTADERWMSLALVQAHKSLALEEVPVGACVVIDDVCVGLGHNRPIETNDPTAHAEIQAIREATEATSNYRLINATLYVTLEPCLRCVGAMVQSRISRLVFGATDPKKSFVAELDAWYESQAVNHRFHTVGGIMADDCAKLLRSFFNAKR